MDERTDGRADRRNLSVFALDVVLITALYVVLKPVNRNLALLAAFWGLIETAILVVTVEYYGGPIFIFELTMGFWLLLKGLRPTVQNRSPRS